jgi:hypothetical protein
MNCSLANFFQLRLIRHDLFLLRNLWIGLMGTGVEKITFWIGAVAVSLILYSALRSSAADIGMLPNYTLALYFFVLGFFVRQIGTARLSSFVSSTVFAADALFRQHRVLYGLCCALAVLILNTPLILVFQNGKPANQSFFDVVLLSMTYAAGGIFYSVVHHFFKVLRLFLTKLFSSSDRRPDRTAGCASRIIRLSTLCLVRQAPFAQKHLPALCIIGFIAMVAAGGVIFLAENFEKTEFLVFTLILYGPPLLLLSRLDSVLLKYASSVGFQLPAIILAHTFSSIIYSLLFLLFLSVFLTEPPLFFLASILIVWFVTGLIVIVRICYYLTLPKKKADFIIQVDFLIAMMLASVFPPLAAVVLAVRWIIAWRKARSAVWMTA